MPWQITSLLNWVSIGADMIKYIRLVRLCLVQTSISDPTNPEVWTDMPTLKSDLALRILSVSNVGHVLLEHTELFSAK